MPEILLEHKTPYTPGVDVAGTLIALEATAVNYRGTKAPGALATIDPGAEGKTAEALYVEA